ncbi:MAG: signal peptide peptidase SppA [Candidatus Neomarinimicrobiota bacterium]|nr:MAG: signal peptide peptidase SppA [Candidatus Neomarinimicrobiota bacterium]
MERPALPGIHLSRPETGLVGEVQLKRQRPTPNRWVWTLLALILAFFLLSQIRSCGREDDGLAFGSRVGQVTVEGPIFTADKWVAQLEDFRERSDIKSIVLRINSPGGGVAASQELFETVKRVNAEKPVVVSMGSVAASGGYYIALGARTIMANRGTVTGSIGVIMEYPVVTEFMSKVGLEMETVKSGPLKDAGSPTREATAADRAYFQEVVQNLYDQFVADVAAYRKLPEGEVRALADGRVYTGVQAQEAGLVDTLGTLTDAIALAGQLGGIPGRPRVVKPVERTPWIKHLLWGAIQQLAGEGVQEGPLFRWQWRVQ